MGINVFTQRCHRHNISHPQGQLCSKCEVERSGRYVRLVEAQKRDELEKEARQIDKLCSARHSQLDALVRQEIARLDFGQEIRRTVRAELRELQEPSNPAHEDMFTPNGYRPFTPGPNYRELLCASVIAAAQAGRLRRYKIPETSIPSGGMQSLSARVLELSKLLYIEVDVSENLWGAKGSQVIVQSVRVGCRTIAEGGSIAQLSGAPLACVVLNPATGVQLYLENMAASCVAVHGTVVASIQDAP